MSGTNKQIYIPKITISGSYVEEIGSPEERLIYPGTPFDIDRLTAELNVIHQSKNPDINTHIIYDLYVPKLVERFSLFPSRFIEDGKPLVHRFTKFFEDYREQQKAIPCVMHGDSVFTNIFLDKKHTLKFIDMRGMIGNTRTIFGDKNYDYAKVMQSLLGYDFILRNVSQNKNYTQNLISRFLSKTNANQRDVMMIAAYLLFTLIPLHDDNQNVQNQCFALSKAISLEYV